MSTTEPASGFFSTAYVEVDRPSRYAKQLANHMGHKVQATDTAEGWELFFDPSRAILRPHDGVQPSVLEMIVWSPTTAGLESVQGTLERHLQKFTTRMGGVSVVWQEG
jgi:hypothetical protein